MPKQIRCSIPTHLHDRFLAVGNQLGTSDATVIVTHILNCYFAGTPKPCKTAIPEFELVSCSQR